ncbi:MAG: BlaI/MecI/CopY family transcriptional regulator [Oscillospiraceae bacterium]|jgi:predicted transcriptional regulator|nr:BlaI/MecI/CopY family transcriptional regulator [Oscillospiraceae bacterium]
MSDLKLHDSEYKFISVIWDLEPVNSTELVRACETRLGWKKSTTYTMLRKLADRELLKNENATVTTLVTRGQARKYEAEMVLNRSFDGSLPAFIAAFLQDRPLMEKDALIIWKMIQEARK